jgi:signal transduction histidine kinase
MLRNLTVRSKLLAILAVPLASLLAVCSLLGVQASGEARQSERVRQLTEASSLLNRLVHELQAERSATAALLENGAESDRAELDAQRNRVDLELADFSDVVADLPAAQVSSAVAEGLTLASTQHDTLPTLRATVDAAAPVDAEPVAAEAVAQDVAESYDLIIDADLQLPQLVAQSAGDDELATALRAYAALSDVIDQSTREQDLLTSAFRTESVNRIEYSALAGMLARQDSSLRTFADLASPAAQADLRLALDDVDTVSFATARVRAQDMLSLRPGPTDPAQWAALSGERISALTSVENRLVQDVTTLAQAQVDDARRAAALVSIGAVLAFGLALLVALVCARRMVEPLHRLTEAAAQTAQELPAMVEAMQTPGTGPQAQARTIPVTSTDEIGQLATAFNAVNEVSARVANEQAALRTSISEMFVNVARRNQVLLGRQLSFIDQLEAREENPDVLKNLFRLDHLATRMRRNAESLLVLAGIDSTRRLRSPLPLSDVVRTAVSEIESYDRVDLAVDEDAPVSGRLALTVAHLLAELLENATQFSDPDTRVVVTTAPGAGGIDVTVTDRGLGMSEEELASANATIASPPVTEIAVAQRLGFYVVGRLAARLGAAVAVRPGEGHGTVVTVTLPADVFDGEVTTLPVIEGGETRTSSPAPEPSDGRTSPAPGLPGSADAAAPAAPPAPAAHPAVEHAAPVEPASTPPATRTDSGTGAVNVLPWREPRHGSGLLRRRGAPVTSDSARTPSSAGAVTLASAGSSAPAPATSARGAGPAPSHGATSAAVPTFESPTFEAPTGPMPVGQPMPPPGSPQPVPSAAPWQLTQPSLGPAPAAPSAVPSGVPSALPSRPPAGPRVGSPSALPSRRPAPAAADQGGGDAAPVPAVTDLEQLAAASRLQSEALTELSRLYAPSYAPTTAPSGGLTRRTPRAPAATPEPVPAPAAAPGGATDAERPRNASEVRGMLAGFRAGVERGRSSSGTSSQENPTPPSENQR